MQGTGGGEEGASHVTGGKAVREDVGEINVTALALERKRRKAAGIDDDGGGWQVCHPSTHSACSAFVLAGMTIILHGALCVDVFAGVSPISA